MHNVIIKKITYYLPTVIKIALAVFIMCFNSGISAQTIQTPFGKNRVQYHDDFNNWWMYETENFVSFWYGKGRNIAKSVMQLAEMEHDEIEQILAHSMNDKIRIIIYLDHSDYSQTNIAYWENKEAGGAGKAQFYDNKVIVYFDGDHQNLKKQIRSGIVRAYMHSMFNGISIQEIYQNMVSSELPNWFSLGLIDYLTEKWPSKQQEELGYYFREKPGRVKKFTSFAKEHPTLAGHSMWHYLSDHYGDQSISDFLYLVRIHNDIKKAFKYTYSQEPKVIYRDWNNYYREMYGKFKLSFFPDSVSNVVRKFKHTVPRIILSEDGQQMVYVENNFGRVKVIVSNLEGKEARTLLKYGYKNENQLADLHYPLLKFDRTNGHIGIIYEVKDKLLYRDLNLSDNSFTDVLFPENVQRIYDFDYEKPGFLLFAGSMDGFSDLFLFNLEKRQSEALSSNYFDEKEIVKLRRSGDSPIEYLVISNNEGDPTKAVSYDSFPVLADFDLFKINDQFNKSENLTNTIGANESAIQQMENGSLLLLSDQQWNSSPEYWEKKDNESFGKLASLVSNKEILSHAYSAGNYVYIYKNKPDEWVIAKLDNVKSLFGREQDVFENPFNINLENSRNSEEKNKTNLNAIEIAESLLFQTEFKDPEEAGVEDIIAFIEDKKEDSGKDPGLQLPVFKSSRAVASRLRFNFSQLITKVDNQPLFDGLEVYNQLQDSYNPPPSGFLMKSTIRDLFEDHVIEGGLRLASDFRGMEYFISYDRLKNKWDWKYGLYRKNSTRYENINEQSTQNEKIKLISNIALVKAKYPFDVYRSIHLSGTLRFDRNIVTAGGAESINYPDDNAQRLILGVEYIFDNSSQKAQNLRSGSRYKIFAQFSDRFKIQLYDPLTFNLSEGLMGVIGFDARHYLDVLKHSTLAMRVAGQSSFGTEQNLYFLGGVENWFFSRSDDTYPIPPDQTFAFKVQAGNMRGFPYNVRNGSTFLVSNIELRIPLFSYLFDGHIKMAALRDFQFVAFFDSGMAWYGLTPFSEKNNANVYYLEAPPAVLLKIRQFKDPLVGGMGFGIRTSIMGYFLKLDYAYGIENSKILPPMMYFSLGYDF